MSKLSAKQRNELPASDFGLSAQRKFPVNNPAHAANAKARATQQVKAGNLSPAQKATIDRKADKVMGKSTGAAKKMASY